MDIDVISTSGVVVGLGLGITVWLLNEVLCLFKYIIYSGR